jgi:DNA-binding MarR family transcriptional regulator
MEFGDSKPPEELSRYTGFLLNWVAAGSKRRFEAALNELGLRLHQFALMNVVAAHPGRTQQSLGDSTHIDPSTMVQVLDALSEAGLAERRPHESDRRKHTIHLTKTGEELLVKARQAAGRVGDESFAALDDDERETLRMLLRKAAGLDAGDPA